MKTCMMSGSFLPLQWMIGSLFGTLAPSSYKGELYNMNEELDDTYKAVFRQCYPKLLFYATRLVGTEEAEDVVQDVFRGVVEAERFSRHRRADFKLSFIVLYIPRL